MSSKFWCKKKERDQIRLQERKNKDGNGEGDASVDVVALFDLRIGTRNTERSDLQIW